MFIVADLETPKKVVNGVQLLMSVLHPMGTKVPWAIFVDETSCIGRRDDKAVAAARIAPVANFMVASIGGVF